MSDSVRPHRWKPTRLLCPWDSPGKNTGVGCHFLLQCMKVKSESEVAQSGPTLHDPMDCSLPGSSPHRISQARVLEWGAIAFSNTNAINTIFWWYRYTDCPGLRMVWLTVFLKLKNSAKARFNQNHTFSVWSFPRLAIHTPIVLGSGTVLSQRHHQEGKKANTYSHSGFHFQYSIQ